MPGASMPAVTPRSNGTPATASISLCRHAAGPQQPRPAVLDLDDGQFEPDRRRAAIDHQRDPAAEVARHRLAAGAR